MFLAITPIIISLIYFILTRVCRKSEVVAFSENRGGLVDDDFFKTIRLTKKVLRLDILFYGAFLVYALIFGAFFIVEDQTTWVFAALITTIVLGIKVHLVYCAYVKYCMTVEDICKEEFQGDENVYQSQIR